MRHAGKRAVVDLDDTLGYFRREVMEALNSITNTKSHYSDWTTNVAENNYPITDFLDIVYKLKLSEKARPHPEAAAFMNFLRVSGVEVTVLTARGWHPNAEEISRTWLNDNRIHFDNLIVCGLEECKADYIRNMDNVLLFVDDSQKHCNAVNALGDKRPEFVFSYAMKWNENVDEGVIRISDLNETLQHLGGFK